MSDCALSQDPNHFLRTNSLAVLNTAAASLCCAALAATGAAFARRVWRAACAGRTWWPFQRRLVAFAGAQLALQLVNAAFYLVRGCRARLLRDFARGFCMLASVNPAMRLAREQRRNPPPRPLPGAQRAPPAERLLLVPPV